MNKAKTAASTTSMLRCSHSGSPPEARPATIGKQDHPQNVVEDSGAEDDLSCARSQYSQIPEDARRDPHTGRNHGCANENRFRSRVAEPFHIAKAERKRHKDSSDRDQQSLTANADQILRVGFQASAEQHEDRTDLRHRIDRVTRMNPGERMWAEHRPSQDFAQDRRQAQSFENFAYQLRRRKD